MTAHKAIEKIDTINIDDLSLELLKRYYGKLSPVKKKENYWNIDTIPLKKILDTLKIKQLNTRYIRIAVFNSDEYKKKISQRMRRKNTGL